jgi:hypothetical protein
VRTPTVDDLIAHFGITDEELAKVREEEAAREVYMAEWRKTGIWNGPEDMSEQGVENRQRRAGPPPWRR